MLAASNGNGRDIKRKEQAAIGTAVVAKTGDITASTTATTGTVPWAMVACEANSPLPFQYHDAFITAHNMINTYPCDDTATSFFDTFSAPFQPSSLHDPSADDIRDDTQSAASAICNSLPTLANPAVALPRPHDATVPADDLKDDFAYPARCVESFSCSSATLSMASWAIELNGTNAALACEREADAEMAMDSADTHLARAEHVLPLPSVTLRMTPLMPMPSSWLPLPCRTPRLSIFWTWLKPPLKLGRSMMTPSRTTPDTPRRQHHLPLCHPTSQYLKIPLSPRRQPLPVIPASAPSSSHMMSLTQPPSPPALPSPLPRLHLLP